MWILYEQEMKTERAGMSHPFVVEPAAHPDARGDMHSTLSTICFLLESNGPQTHQSYIEQKTN
jgi:hypothetical protein